MIGLDTNVLVRYLTQDDKAQAKRATKLIEQQISEEAPGFIGIVVLAEAVWVLQRLYSASFQEVLQTVRDLLASRNIVIEDRNVVARAVAVSERSGAGFPDALIAMSAASAGCDEVVTFDRGAVRAGMLLLG